MQRYSYIYIILIGLIFFLFVPLNPNTYAGVLKEEAAPYREQGYLAQERGDIETAISWYQKAANLDPDYATPHNDLGILFEAKGWVDRAEEEYLKAIAIDPKYDKAHTNLAL
ncbi:MAG: tetratricopeptide repeat protein, partial [Candidatus Omnitrophota bacterium]|nr:tetratricopeptide repeat protein [Candidatus Omnitrophota bacterium]